MALKEESHIYPSFCFYILFKACICGKSINKQSHVFCMAILTSKFTFSNRNLWDWKVFAWVFLSDVNAEFWNNRPNGECYQYYIWHSCKGLKQEVISLYCYLTRKTPKKTKCLQPVFLDRFCQHKWNRWIKWVTICLLNSVIVLQLQYGVQMNSKGFIWWLFPLLWPSSKKFAFVFRNTETCIYRTFHSDCTKIGNIYTYHSES